MVSSSSCTGLWACFLVLDAVAGAAGSWVAYGGEIALNSGDEDGVASRREGRPRGCVPSVVRLVAMGQALRGRYRRLGRSLWQTR